MNTANLQLEGLYVALSALMSALREKDLLSEAEIETALRAAEEKVSALPRKATSLTPSHAESICFPLRYLRLANEAGARGEDTAFQEIAARVGRSR